MLQPKFVCKLKFDNANLDNAYWMLSILLFLNQNLLLTQNFPLVRKRKVIEHIDDYHPIDIRWIWDIDD